MQSDDDESIPETQEKPQKSGGERKQKVGKARVRFVSQTEKPWDVRIVTRPPPKEEEASDQEETAVEMKGKKGKTPWEIKVTPPKKKKGEDDTSSEEEEDASSDSDASSGKKSKKKGWGKNKEDAEAIKMIAAVQRARRVDTERRRVSGMGERERLDESGTVLVMPTSKGERDPKREHAPTHMDARIPPRMAWEIAEEGGGGSSVWGWGVGPREWGSSGRADSDRLVCLRNYAAVGIDVDAEEPTAEPRDRKASRKCYGLIDRGQAPEAGVRTLLLHVRGGMRKKGKRDGGSIMDTVCPGSILQVYSTSPSSDTGVKGRSLLRVRYTTPARYYSPGEKITTLRLGVDAADWQMLMPKYRRI
jgi:hypothetical protein